MLPLCVFTPNPHLSPTSLPSAPSNQQQASHKGGPRLTCADVCTECLGRMMQGLVSNQDLAGLRDQVLAALEGDEGDQEGLMDAPTSYYVSRTWVNGFKRRSGAGGASGGRLEPPTAGVLMGRDVVKGGEGQGGAGA